MKNKLGIIVLLSLMIISCNRIKEGAKHTVNKGGEAVGETATEFFEGVSEGVDKTLECEITLSPALVKRGLSLGKTSIEDSPGGKNNQLILYIIFDHNFNDTLMARVYDKKGLEIGRTRLAVSGKANDAGYFDFIFDKRTYIEVRSKIVIESTSI